MSEQKPARPEARAGARQRVAADGKGMPMLLDARQMAELMNVDVTTVLGWRRRDVLPPPIVVGRVVRWALSDLCDWIEEHREVRL